MSAQHLPRVIAGDEALAAFRQGLTGPYAHQLLQDALGRLLIDLPVGVGKTQWMIRIIVHELTVACEYDLVVVFVPRRDILKELVAKLPDDLSGVVLDPRPRKRCGDLDEAWQSYEQN